VDDVAGAQVDDVEPAARFGVALGEGVHTIVLPQGVVTGLNGVTNEAFLSQFSLDFTPPKLIATSLMPNDTLLPGDIAVHVQFSEPMRRASFAAAYLRVGSTTISAAVIDQLEAGDAFDIYFSDIPEGDYTLTLRSGSSYFADLVRNTLDGEIDPGTTVPSGDGTAGGDFVMPIRVEVDGVLPIELQPIRSLASAAFEQRVDGSLDETDTDIFR